MPTPEAPLSRVMPLRPGEDVAAMTLLACTMPPDIARRTDAIIVMPNMGETERLTDALGVWHSPSTVARHLLIAGTSEPEGIAYDAATLAREPFSVTRPEGIVYQGHTANARTQAEWIEDRVLNLGIKSAALMVSAYQLPRAIGTVAACFNERGNQVPVFPVPVRISPHAVVPGTGLSGMATAASEYARIRQYQEAGHVLTLEEMSTYIGRLWRDYPNIVRPARTA